jgi:hypothetical protein
MTDREDLAHLQELSSKIIGWFTEFGPMLVPPQPEPQDDRLMSRIREELEVEAAALFLTPDNDPTQLRFVAGTGYKKAYENVFYFLNQRALTSYVFSKKEALNLCVEELKKKDCKYPFRGMCKEHIATGKFRNIVAVPIVFEENIRFGVLKLENKKGTSESERFPAKDFEIVRVLATMLGVVLQARVSTRLWTEGELLAKRCASRAEYLPKVTELLTRVLNAECASVFMYDDEPTEGGILRYQGGVGYTQLYSEHEYPVPKGGGDAESLTAHVASKRTCVRATEELLTEGTEGATGVPYTGACRKHIGSGTFRNVLAIPLVKSFDVTQQKSLCLGTLKIENRKPEGTDFGVHDEAVCKAFVTKQIVPTLLGFIAPQLRRADFLVESLGASQELSGEEARERFSKVMEIRSTSKGITDKECMEYLQMKRATYYRWKREAVSQEKQ